MFIKLKSIDTYITLETLYFKRHHNCWLYLIFAMILWTHKFSLWFFEPRRFSLWFFELVKWWVIRFWIFHENMAKFIKMEGVKIQILKLKVEGRLQSPSPKWIPMWMLGPPLLSTIHTSQTEFGPTTWAMQLRWLHSFNV